MPEYRNEESPDGELLEFSNLSIKAALEKLRYNLLDIGTRNRLINAPLKNARANALEVVDELSDEIFRILWVDGRTFTFLSNPDEKTGGDDRQLDDGLPVYIPPEDEDVENYNGVDARHLDTKLQTRLYRETLQKRLVALTRDANLFEEEQGVNILFLGIGFLKWYDSGSSSIERYAPLLLLPVSLERDQIRSRFKLRRRDEDIEVNLSLRAKLKQDFVIDLPDFPEGGDWLPSDYFSLVANAIAQNDRWSVEADRMLLGFYSFSKFLLYRDLDPSEWPNNANISKINLVSSLLVNGFGENVFDITEAKDLDEILDPEDLGHVMDADASQAAVIKFAADGHNLVVQGPPGTGKSQSITNVIAAATKQGKTVLFIAEKMAALNVVYDRLCEVGLGPLCLELHSRKANKKAVIEELKRTLELGRVAGEAGNTAGETKIVRDKLNEISKLLHSAMDGIDDTPYQVLSELVWLREEGLEPSDLAVGNKLLTNFDLHTQALAALRKLSDRTLFAGPANLHPWCGVENRLTPMDVDRLKPKIQDLEKLSKRLEEIFGDANKIVHTSADVSIASVQNLIKWLRALSEMPEHASHILARDSIREQPNKALELLSAAAKLRQKYDVVLESAKQIALQQDWSEARQAIAMHGRSLFRFFNGSFKRAVALLNSVTYGAPVKLYDERLAQIDMFIDYQRGSKMLAADDDQAQAFFGTRWQGRTTDVRAPQAAINWYVEHEHLLASHTDLIVVLEECPDKQALVALSIKLEDVVKDYMNNWREICETLGLNLNQAFSEADSDEVSKVGNKLFIWQTNYERLDEWYALRAEEAICRELGLDSFVESLASGELNAYEAVNSYRYARAEALWKLMIGREVRLLDIRGDDRSELIERFCALETELFNATALEIAAKHTANIPSGAQGQMGVIRGETGKRRRHRPIRKLVEDAGDALQQIKPVFLMSPISVAQYLPPGRINFDLVLVDEASQVRPEDSIGAIARGQSVVVVGDSKQLPPTSFFDRTIGNIGQDDDEEEADINQPGVHAGAMESILTLCDARGMPSKTLQWHYRSRHPSLIQVSNDIFYENKLKFPPSPQVAGRDGLIFRKVNGIYDRGKTRTNKIEAQNVANAVMQHARVSSNLSLGVVTLSTAQRNMIEGELELLRASNPELEYFFSRDKPEAFFVKNLENVQGDERDVIFISVCYARDADKFMSQAFGPVNGLGGERRLNVLFTRAKRRCEIFSSITEKDVEIGGAHVPIGRTALHAYLKFARTGETDVPQISGKEPDSLFEEVVIKRIRTAGYTVDPQVGTAGFYVDMAIRDPANPDSYLLGVECDGATYHSAAWARERDRLRQQVLEAKGWTIYRIWSTDWFQRPDQEFQKLLMAIDKAKAIQEASMIAEENTPQRRTPISFEREESLSESPIVSVPYVEASLAPLTGYDKPHLVPAHELAELVQSIVQIEQPIHVDEVARRVAKTWGLQKAGSRIRATVLDAAVSAKRNGVRLTRDYLSTTDSKPLQVRDRSEVESITLRKAEYLPPNEIDLAICESVGRNVGAISDDIARDVAIAFGFKSTSAQLKTAIYKRIKRLKARGKLEINAGHIILSSPKME